MTIAADLLSKAQDFVDGKFVARADELQKKLGLSYITVERVDLALEIARFSCGEMVRVRRRYDKVVDAFFQLVCRLQNPFEPDSQSELYKRMRAIQDEFFKEELGE